MIKRIIDKFKAIFSGNKTDSIEFYRSIGVRIGEECKFYNVYIDNGHGYLVSIGDNCILTNCTILAHDASVYPYLKKSKVGLVSIGNNCFVGLGSIILPNVTIGNNCIIGAGCVVSKNIPDNSVVVGNPCRVIASAQEFIEKHKENMKTYPVYNTYWKNKTSNEKIKERNELMKSYGYDE